MARKWSLEKKQFAAIDRMLAAEVNGIVEASRLLTHPTRVKMMLVAGIQNNLCLGEFATLLEIEFPTLIYHAHILEYAKFIELRKHGSYLLVSLTMLGREHLPTRVTCDPAFLAAQ